MWHKNSYFMYFHNESDIDHNTLVTGETRKRFICLSEKYKKINHCYLIHTVKY